MRLLLGEDGAGEITSDVIEASVFNRDERVLGLLLNRCGADGVSGAAIIGAIQSGNEKNLNLLLNHCYSMSQTLVIEAAAEGYASTLRLLLDRGGLITGPVLRCAADNSRDGANVVSLLLAEANDWMILQEMKGLMKVAAQSSREGLAIMRQLLERPGSSPITEDVLATADISFPGGEMIKLLSGRDWKMTKEVLEVMMQYLASEEALQLVLDRVDDMEITKNILLAAASNRLFDDKLVGRLLDRVNLWDVIDPLLVEAAGNEWFGPEVILLLQRRVGAINVTPKAIEKACQEGAVRTVLYLLDHSSAPITESIMLGALRSGRLQLVKLMLNRVTDLPVTSNMVHMAVRYSAGSCCLAFFRERGWIAEDNEDVIEELIQAAIMNDPYWAEESLRFFLKEIKNIVVSPETLICIARKDWEPVLLLNLLIFYGVRLQITCEVLRAAAGSICDDSSLMISLLERSESIELSEEVFKAAAGSGSRKVLQVLSDYCGMAEISKKWLDLALLHDTINSGFGRLIPTSHRRLGDDDLERVTVLLSRGVEPDVPDAHGFTPLFHAAFMGETTAVQALLSAGENPNSMNRHGSTPLFCAASSGQYAIVELLLDLGVATHHKNERGQTPASIAKSRGHIKVFKRLERRRQP